MEALKNDLGKVLDLNGNKNDHPPPHTSQSYLSVLRPRQGK